MPDPKIYTNVAVQAIMYLMCKFAKNKSNFVELLPKEVDEALKEFRNLYPFMLSSADIAQVKETCIEYWNRGPKFGQTKEA